MPGTTLPRGNVLNGILVALTLTPAQVAANTTAEQTFALIGLQVGDYVNVNFAGAQTAGIFIANCRCATAGIVSIGFGNCTGGALTPASGTYGFAVVRPEGTPATTAT